MASIESRPPGAVGDGVGGKARLTRTRTLIWLGAWVVLTVGLCMLLATAWPNEGHYAAMGLWVAVPGIVSRALDLAAAEFPGRLRWRLLRRVIAVVTGIPAAGLLWMSMSRIADESFEAAMAPLVAQVHAQAAAPCPPAASYTVEPALRQRLRGAPGRLSEVPLFSDAAQRRFVLRLPGGSFDIDGSTIWYDSSTRHWQRFHNDWREQRQALEAMLATMVACALPLP